MEKPKAIVGDGSVFMRTMLRTHLEALNFEVAATAKDGREALNMYLEVKPDIGLIDIAIAEADDFALIRAVQENVPLSAIFVMIPEQAGFPELVVDAVRAGASGYIKKPVSPEDLKSRIKSVLRR